MTFLINKKISLRAVEPNDLPYLYQIENKESARQYGSSIMPNSKHIIKQFIKEAGKDIFETKQLRLVIEHNAECKAVGMIDLFEFSPIHKRAGVGIWIDSPYRQQGLAGEALECLISYAFDTLLMHQLFCHISSDNLLSIKLFKKAGFKECGVLKEWRQTKNGFQDIIVFQRINASHLK